MAPKISHYICRVRLKKESADEAEKAMWGMDDCFRKITCQATWPKQASWTERPAVSRDSPGWQPRRKHLK